MLRNYFTLAFRQLRKNKTYSFINVFGLGLGLATGFIMLLWVTNEYGMNGYHKAAGRIYQITQVVKWGDEVDTWEMTPAPLANYIKTSLPAVQNAVRFKIQGDKQPLRIGNENFLAERYGYAENSLFDIFDFPVVKGNKNEPFANGLSVVLTESAAKKYFGNREPLGQAIRFRDTTCFVSAVLKDLPAASSFQFDLLFSLDVVRAKFRGNGKWKTIDEDWGNASFLTFVLLKDAAEQKSVSAALLSAMKTANPESAVSAYGLQPLKNIYLYKADGTKGRVILVQIFFWVALFVLAIAAINYINLVTARATQRIKEIGIRKVIGAEKRQLFGQFFTETGVLLVLSAAAAVLLIQVLLPLYQQVSGNKLAVSFSDGDMWRLIATMGLSIWLITGAYPAFLLASFKTIPSLKGESGVTRTGWLRKSLVVLQFVVSLTLLLSTVIIHRQMAYVQSRNLNLTTSNIVSVPVYKLKDAEGFKTGLASLPGIEAITSSSVLLFDGINSTGDIDWPGKPADAKLVINQFDVDKNFLSFFDTKILHGTDFKNTTVGTPAYVLNETAVRKMGLKNPVGKIIKLHEQPGTVIGVVKDFHFESLHKEIGPAILQYQPGNLVGVYAKVSPAQTEAFVTASQMLWKQYETALPMEYHFLDDQIALNYDKENRAKRLFDAFAFITFFISCLGLFGLATHSAERRVKEVGVRKVLGASVGQIAGLLSKEFLTLVVLAMLVAVPLVYLGMSKLLQYFAYRIALSGWLFFVTCAAAALMAMLTVGIQTVRAASANPVKSLRSE